VSRGSLRDFRGTDGYRGPDPGPRPLDRTNHAQKTTARIAFSPPMNRSPDTGLPMDSSTPIRTRQPNAAPRRHRPGPTEPSAASRRRAKPFRFRPARHDPRHSCPNSNDPTHPPGGVRPCVPVCCANCMLAGLAPRRASAGAAGCRVQGAPSQSSVTPWPRCVFDDAPMGVKCVVRLVFWSTNRRR
jgi:hypothetical protein